MFGFFFRKSGLIQSFLSPEDILWFYIDWYKCCNHLRSLNFRHFNGFSYDFKNYGIGVIFNGMTSQPNFMKLPIASKVDRGQTQTGT
jgi:hypothetical protein